MPDDLYQRYLDALAVYQDHRTACTDPDCSNFGRCGEGERLWTKFTRSQDAYLERQKQQR